MNRATDLATRELGVTLTYRLCRKNNCHQGHRFRAAAGSIFHGTGSAATTKE